MYNIVELLNNLSWNNPQKIQEDAINTLASINDLDVLKLLQQGDKSCWENAAKVLEKIGYPRIKIAIPGLFEWLEDLNWPGALIIMNILEKIEINVLIPYIENALLKANNEKDYVWISWIKHLIHKMKIEKSDFHQKEVYDLINLAD